MPPRLPLPRAGTCCRLGPIEESPSLASIVPLFASLAVQTRQASILASFKHNRGAVKNPKRVGRGPSSGYGKTAGRGMNGQKQKAKVRPWFQGGQTPLINVHGRKGFINQ